MKIRHVSFLFILIFAASLISCGGGGGGGSNGGSTNIRIDSKTVSSATHSIDVTTAGEVTAKINLTASNLAGPDFNPFPADITSCIITYTPDAGTDASLSLPSTPSFTPDPGCLGASGASSCGATLLLQSGKTAYLNAVNLLPDPTTITHYVATYSCDYRNTGGTGSFTVPYDIYLSASVQPLSVDPTSGTIPANGSTSQTFEIIGGIGPYQLFPSEDPLTLVSILFDGATFKVTGSNVAGSVGKSVTITVKDTAVLPLHPQQSTPVTVTLN